MKKTKKQIKIMSLNNIIHKYSNFYDHKEKKYLIPNQVFKTLICEIWEISKEVNKNV